MIYGNGDSFLSFDDSSDELSIDREHVNVDENIDFNVMVVEVQGIVALFSS